MEKTKYRTAVNVKQLVVLGLLSGIILFLGFSGFGYVQLPIARITIVHIPVMIGALIEGPKAGMFLAFIFGASSIYQNIVAPTSLSFAILNPLVSILPRLLIPLTCYYSYKLIKIKKESVRLAVAGFIGSMTNTVGFLGMIFLLYLDKYADSYRLTLSGAKKAIMGIVYTNGIIEAIGAAIIVSAVVSALKKIKR